MDGMPCAERLDEGHHLTLVVHGPARDHTLTVLGIDDGRLERRAIPKLQRLGRLHVVVAVVEHVRPRGARRSGMMRHHHGMAGGVPQARLEPHAVELIGQPLGRLTGFILIGGIGADASDAQQVAEPFYRLIEIAVEMGQHGSTESMVCPFRL